MSWCDFVYVICVYLVCSLLDVIGLDVYVLDVYGVLVALGIVVIVGVNVGVDLLALPLTEQKSDS